MSKEIYQPDPEIIGSEKKETPKSPESIPCADDFFSEEDLKKWSEGAANYKLFAKDADNISRYNESDIGPVQALFLGEKPAVFKNMLAFDNKAALEQFGFKCEGLYCFNPDLVQKVIETNREHFSLFHNLSPEAVIRELNSADNAELNTPRGLILGFPPTSSKDYEKADQLQIEDLTLKLYELLPESESKYLEINYLTEKRQNNQVVMRFIIDKLFEYKDKLGLDSDDLARLSDELKFTIDARGINIHGIQWSDYRYSEESEKKQRRLRSAFEKSGILS